MKKGTKIKIFIAVTALLIYMVLAVAGIGLLVQKVIIPELKPISAEKVKESVVMLKIYDENGDQLGQGSGFSFKDKNKIITNYHVIQGADKIVAVTDDGREIVASRILIFDKINDLALIEGEFELQPVRYVSSFWIAEDDKVTTISSPRGKFNTVTEGKVSAVYQDATEMIVSIMPGSSGGAVLNEYGRVFGVIVANIDMEKNQSLAINIELAESLYEDYKDEGYGLITSKPEDLESFMPDIFDDKNGNELTITDTWKKDKNKIYRPESLPVFNQLTSSYNIFNRIAAKRDDGFSRIYKGFSEKKKDEAVDWYQYLKSFDSWWFSKDNSEFDETVNQRKEDPLKWSNEQLLMDLSVLDRYELAIFAARIDDIKYYEDLEAVVNKLPLEKAKKLLIMLTIGGDKPRDLSRKENNLVKEYAEKAMVDDSSRLTGVLDRLGY